jgi:hypothetical protein
MRGITMNIRKIAVVGSFAAGAALALAPIAAADDLTSIDATEISSLNALFTVDTDLAGDSADVVTHAGSFDTIPLADAPLNGTGTLDSLLYGVDPLAAGPSSDPGAYDVLNGALVEFDDAFNVELYSLENNGALPPAADLIGSSTNITDGLNSTNPAEFFFNFGLGDLQGYFDTSSLSDASTLSDLGGLTDLGSLGDGLTGLLGDLGSLGGSLF